MSTDALLIFVPSRKPTPEIWRPIAGYEVRYAVSSHGRVWSLVTQKFLAAAGADNGYLAVVLHNGNRPGERKTFTVHELVAATFNGQRPSGLSIDHVDGDKRNNHADNLEYVTTLENNRRAKAIGLTDCISGTGNHMAKLTEDGVRRLREWKSSGKPRGLSKIANELGRVRKDRKESRKSQIIQERHITA